MLRLQGGEAGGELGERAGEGGERALVPVKLAALPRQPVGDLGQGGRQGRQRRQLAGQRGGGAGIGRGLGQGGEAVVEAGDEGAQPRSPRLVAGAGTVGERLLDAA